MPNETDIPVVELALRNQGGLCAICKQALVPEKAAMDIINPDANIFDLKPEDVRVAHPDCAWKEK